MLRCGPGEHESRLSFAALRDLLEAAFDDTAGRLPPPQRRALAIALLREEPEATLDRGAVSAAFLTFLRERSRIAPVVVVVDDVQWLDRPTASALEFAIRRLREEPVGLVLALRSAGSGHVALDLDRALSPDRLHRISLGPLSLGALQAMLRARLGRSWPRPLLRRIHENSDGNPFFALEIARALEPDWTSPGSALPVPRDLEELLRARIDVLPAHAVLALLVVSATSQPTRELVAAASGLDLAARDALAVAERAGVIEIRAGHVRFTHPLLASTVYAGASPDARRAVHRALADSASDPEERARHLALSSEGPDMSIAAVLDDAARSAHARGAPDSAAELAALASELTPPEDREGVIRRRVDAAGHLFDAGSVIRAQELFLEAAAATPRGPARADILWRLADASWMEVDLVRGYLQEGLEDASGDLRLESGIRMGLAWTWIYGGDVARATAEARTALEIAERLDAQASVSEALAVLGICEFLAGRDGADRIASAVELSRTSSYADTYTSPRVTMGLRSLWAGDLEAARSTLEAVLEHLADRGLYTIACEAHEYLAETEWRAGRSELAAGHARTAIEIKLGAGHEELNAVDLYPQALVEALRGDVLSAREHATHGMRWSERGDRLYANYNRAVLGFLELSLERYSEAREHLDAVVRFLRDMGVREPCVIPVHADAIEARIGTGDLGGAAELLGEFEDLGQATGRPWALATSARCRGLLLSASGDGTAALRMFEAALEEHRRVPQALELARTLLAKGMVERRTKHRALARQTLQQAFQMFEELRAPLWSARARTELARIGGRGPAGDALTPTEERIAHLVAEGMTNKEVAATLVVAERTVESALTQIYRKLDVRSRTELARRLPGPG